MKGGSKEITDRKRNFYSVRDGTLSVQKMAKGNLKIENQSQKSEMFLVLQKSSFRFGKYQRCDIPIFRISCKIH